LGVANVDRCTQRKNDSNCHRTSAPNVAGIEGLVSHSCVMKLGFSSVNQTAVDETMSHDFPRKAGKVMGSVLLDEKCVIFMSSLPRWAAVKFYELS
jgi:hypothetical protein